MSCSPAGRWDAVALVPCPPWSATQDRHFDDGEVIDSDDGYRRYGPELAVSASYGMFPDSPVTVVKVFLRSWTHPLGADPGRSCWSS